MKIALVQDEIYIPSYGGGTKANRCLLEGLSHRGHACLALTRALTRSTDGPNTTADFLAEMEQRAIKVESPVTDVYRYRQAGVEVDALDHDDLAQRSDYVTRRLKEWGADWVLVTDDKRRFMLEASLSALPRRVILLLQTIVQLPFGPLSVSTSETYAQQMERARAIVIISQFAQRYIHEHSCLSSRLLSIPVYGDGPFPNFANPHHGFVTMINPCELKGVTLFLGLVRAFPHIQFAAVPTWGADESILALLRAEANITLLPPTDCIDDIFSQTRILIVPSLWPETFGYVVPEAMLRGLPVLASDIGGLPEAKLGVDYLLDVAPAKWSDGTFTYPKQDLRPWIAALRNLVDDPQAYIACAEASRRAATQFVARLSVEPFESLMQHLSATE